MKSVCLHDKSTIEIFLRGNVFLNIYSLGDLDDFFWPYTSWYALTDSAGVQAIALMYTAALGNIRTHPKYRGKGYGTTVTARVCKSLLRDIDHIGLNVKADNISAIRCYERLGFEVIDSYGEFEVELKPS